MFVWTVLLLALTLVHVINTVAFGHAGRRGTGGPSARVLLGNSLTVGFQPAASEVVRRSVVQEGVTAFGAAFRRSFVNGNIMVHHTALFDLPVKHGLEHIVRWGGFHASQDGFPVPDERVQVLINAVDIEEILHVIHCAVFGVGGKECVKLHEDLTSSHQTSGMSLDLFKGVHLAGKIPFEDVGNCREKLRIES
jgi:hypothetical protein